MNRDNGNDLVHGGDGLDFQIQNAELDPGKILELKALLASDLRPVRALPSDGKLAVLFSLFVPVFALLAAWPIHYFGLRALTATQASLYFGVIGGAAVLGALALVQEMVPGSRRRINPFLALAAALSSMIGMVVILFPSTDFTGFVQHGEFCLRFGTICGIVSGLALSLILRRGLFTSRVKGTVAASFLATLVGVGALALHCPLLAAPHIIVWHFGVLLAGLGVGVVLGKLLERGLTTNFFRSS